MDLQLNFSMRVNDISYMNTKICVNYVKLISMTNSSSCENSESSMTIILPLLVLFIIYLSFPPISRNNSV